MILQLVGQQRVSGVELPGHERTADTDRNSTSSAPAFDVAGLPDYLGVGLAHVLGFRLSATVTL